ncbi:MAG TPA: hypothetical protein VKZ68_08065 [Ohtaekwangia sp.]|nr:hypothetical protein [Ohtaekwangia sp.]
MAAIFFAVLFLAQGMISSDLGCEIKKIPNLIAHFEKHQEQNGDSFWQFMVSHFVDTEEHSGDQSDPDHKDLPFHGARHCCHAPAFFLPEVNFALAPVEYEAIVKPAFYDASPSSAHRGAPFQPPKFG